MSFYYTLQIKSINLLNSSYIKAILFYTALNIKLNNTIDFIVF